MGQQIDSPRLLIEGICPDLPLGWLTLLPTTSLWLLQEGVGDLLVSFKALANEALGDSVLRHFAFFPQRILLGLSSSSSVSLSTSSEGVRLVEAIYY